MNKKQLIKNFQDYSPEQIAEAIRTGVVTSYELLHETEGAYTPLLKKQVKDIIEKMEQEKKEEMLQPINCESDSLQEPIKAEKELSNSEAEMIETPSLFTSSVDETVEYSNEPDSNFTETINSSKKKRMFSNPFSFQGRIRRTEYGLSLIIYIIFVFIMGTIKTALNQYPSDSFAGNALNLIYIFSSYWFIWAQGAKRCHDIGKSGFYQLIPFYCLWMLFKEGELLINKYGANPK